MPQRKYLQLFLVVFLVMFCGLIQAARATEPLSLTKGQTVYIPAYSHIYHGNNEAPLLLTVTLSIRNIDPKNSLTVTSVNYHETTGPLVKKYIQEPITLGPLGSERFVVPQRDKAGGSGANFIVEWQSENPVNPPIIESIMIGTQSQLGISFTSRGEALLQ